MPALRGRGAPFSRGGRLVIVPGPGHDSRPPAMLPGQLSELLDTVDVSGRELARRLEVSAMWVSRRMSGEVPISEADADRILTALSP